MSETFPHKTHVLDSGLRLVILPMQGTKTATAYVLVGTGFKYEIKDQAGIAHFLEHMMFKGTTRRPDKLAIARELDGIGAEYNAFTSKEETGYFARASASKADTIMDVVYDIFLNSLIRQEDVDIERGVIAEEINMYKDQPQQHIPYLFEELLYGDQPAGWGLKAWQSALPHLQGDTLTRYFHTQYVAQNTIVAVAGAVDPDRVLQKTQELFTNIRHDKPATKLPIVENQTEPRALIFDKGTDQTHFYIGFRGYSMFDDKRYALALLGNILGSGMSSRLWHEIREKRGLAYYVGAGTDTYTDHGLLAVNAGVNNSKATEAVKVILEELAKVKKDGVTEEELQRAKDQVEGGMVLGLENSRRVAALGASGLLYYGRVLTPEEELDKIKQVTLEDIKRVAQEVFRSERLNLALIGPHKDEQPFTALLKI
ncbi:MAG: pitrilysin family protein [Patescibacteria group bacterium]